MLDTKDITWLAGLWEGEGAFVSQHKQPRITIASTDRDIIERVQRLTFGQKVRQRRSNRWGKKTQWETSIVGKKAAGWMMTIYLCMGLRRRQQILKCLSLWKSLTGPSYEERCQRAAHARARRREKRLALGLSCRGTP